MSPSLEIGFMKPDEETEVSNLVIETFQRKVAPHYTQEGIREFLSYARPGDLLDRQSRNHIMLVASRDSHIIGALELRDHCHVSLLFVAEQHQRKGVGRLLLDEALQVIKNHHPEVGEVTVNSSPNAVSAYKRFGFHVTSEYQVKNGIGFVPMALTLESTNGP